MKVIVVTDQAGGTTGMTLVARPHARPADGSAIDFVVLPDRAQPLAHRGPALVDLVTDPNALSVPPHC